jgi:hypothetical protein
MRNGGKKQLYGVRRRERRNWLLGVTGVLGLAALAAGGWMLHRAPESECGPAQRSSNASMGPGGPGAPSPICLSTAP